jgi:hypothetical protein
MIETFLSVPHHLVARGAALARTQMPCFRFLVTGLMINIMPFFFSALFFLSRSVQGGQRTAQRGQKRVEAVAKGL